MFLQSDRINDIQHMRSSVVIFHLRSAWAAYRNRRYRRSVRADARPVGDSGPMRFLAQILCEASSPRRCNNSISHVTRHSFDQQAIRFLSFIIPFSCFFVLLDPNSIALPAHSLLLRPWYSPAWPICLALESPQALSMMVGRAAHSIWQAQNCQQRIRDFR